MQIGMLCVENSILKEHTENVGVVKEKKKKITSDRNDEHNFNLLFAKY